MMNDESGSGEAGGDAGERRETGGAAGGPNRGQESGGRRGFSDGIRNVNAILSAFKEAVEESFQEARDRGDLSTERARELVQGALSRAREAAGDAKERLDFVSQRDFEQLTRRVREMEVRLARLEAEAGGESRAGEGTASTPLDREDEAGSN